MQKKNSEYIFSPSDLITFMTDEFSSWMDRRYLEDPTCATPDKPDEGAALVQKLGIVHEQQFLNKLRNENRDICVIEGKGEQALADTIAAIHAGRDVIYQGYLRKDSFAGFSDFLVKAPGHSKLGDFQYEVWDSKLAKKPKPYFLIQLCCYAEMIEAIQGCLPEQVAVALGNKQIKTFRTVDYMYYYKSVKQRFLEFQNQFDAGSPPDWLDVGPYSRWTTLANELLEQRDDLVRVANIRKSQIKRFKECGIETLTGLANTERKFVSGMSLQAFTSLKAQAKLQLESVGKERPLFEIIGPDPDDSQKGLSILPPQSANDVYFDMEGYPHIEGGLEYLFGASTIVDDAYQFDDWWAHNLDEEKVAFESFLDWIYARRQTDPQMHVYHYGAYEVSAMRRLASRHATRELLLDELLRAEVFVDLYAIVRNSLRIGCDSYSIKKVELLYMDKRQGEVSKATDSIVYYERWIEHPDGASWRDSRILGDIREYNKIDCESTAQLCSWLRARQHDNGIKYEKTKTKSNAPVVRPLKPNEQLAEDMLSSIPIDRSADPEKWRITELLSHLLGFHGREGKVTWWELFDRVDLAEEELLVDADCIASVMRTSTPTELVGKSLIYEYTFDPDQDVKLEVGDSVVFSSDISFNADIYYLDLEFGIVRLKRSMAKDPLPDSGNLILKETMQYEALETSIRRQAESFRSNSRLTSCVDDLLFKRFPRVRGVREGEPIVEETPDETKAAIDAITRLDNSYLCIQGPPGTGKTYLAARAIVNLISQGKKVGVSSNSHKAIENLLEAIGEAAASEGVILSGAKIKQDKSGVKPKFSNSQIAVVNDDKVIKNLNDYNLIGATAWFFARSELFQQLDYLFVDEAGQVCLANVVAMGQAAQNLVLVGDQLQLDQPVKGSHPGESGLSSLEYLLGDAGTISPERGIFLSTTRRMHSSLSSLVSSAVYDGRLHSDPSADARRLLLPSRTNLISSGLMYMPIEHSGNSQSSIEEVQCIENLIDNLLQCRFLENADSDSRQLILDDIMIVAPYNQQVRLIKSRIPGAKAGSVDRFQGRESIVVIISMCASDLASSPRGLDFLLSKKRLNVAITRAKQLAIIVGSPALSQYACSTVEQAALLNLYCRIMQEGSLAQSATSHHNLEIDFV